MAGCDYPAIVPSPSRLPSPSSGHGGGIEGNEYINGDSKEEGGCVRGVWVEGLTDGDMWRLDIFEGGEYERRRVVCRILGEGEGDVEAETYVWREGEVGLEGGEWDFEEFRREKMGRWVGGKEEEFEGE